MIKPTRVLAATLLATALMVASGCSGSDEGDASPGSGAAPDKVVYMTAFGAVGRDAFAWVAQEKGYFKEAGIEVEIRKGAGTPNLTALKANEAQFAALDFTGAVIQAGKGEFTEWRAVAAVHQQTLVSIMTTKDTGITTPKDLAGKKIAAAANSVNQLLFPAYAQLAGLDPKTVTFQGVQTTALNGLMASRQVDALGTFLLSKGALAKAANKEVVVLPYSDYLADLFGNAIITTPTLLKEKPDLVKRFTEAALKGLQYSIDQPKEAATILNNVEKAYPVESGVGEIEAMKAYVPPVGGAAIGVMDEGRVARTIAILQGSGLIPAGLTPADIVDFSVLPKT